MNRSIIAHAALLLGCFIAACSSSPAVHVVPEKGDGGHTSRDGGDGGPGEETKTLEVSMGDTVTVTVYASPAEAPKACHQDGGADGGDGGPSAEDGGTPHVSSTAYVIDFAAKTLHEHVVQTVAAPCGPILTDRVISLNGAEVAKLFAEASALETAISTACVTDGGATKVTVTHAAGGSESAYVGDGAVCSKTELQVTSDSMAPLRSEIRNLVGG